MSRAPDHARLTSERLGNQRITTVGPRRAADLVAWLGAVQAQEYPAARWALGLRMPDGVTDADLERAFDEGRILRTHVMRPTWHFVTPADIRWMLELTAPHVHRRMAPYNRRLELDAALLTRATGIIERALGDEGYLSRPELGDRLERAGILARLNRLAHIVMHAELEGVICSSPRRGTPFTYALLVQRAPGARRLSRDEALGELALRFFRSHGPATLRDFVWWSGLSSADAKRGLGMHRARSEVVDGRTYWTIDGPSSSGTPRDGVVHLLPVYDEYTVAYRDRALVPHGPAATATRSGATRVPFIHTVVIAGQLAGTWGQVRTKSGLSVEVAPRRPFNAAERRGLASAAARYEAFVGEPVSLSILR